MKHNMLKPQQGFTLLELLVVITLLAVLAVGALVAYEGVGDQAGATAAANNTATVDRAVRNYKAVTKLFPNQWDNLSASDTGVPLSILADTTRAKFGNWDAGTATDGDEILAALEGNGIEEVQQIAASVSLTGIAPNLAHNEGTNPSSTEDEIDTVNNIAVMPSKTNLNCTAGGQSINGLFNGTAAASGVLNNALNRINDSLEVDTCHLVIALGFGHDAAHSTTNSSVAIAQAPTYTSKTINPAKNYARYIGLFHMGSAATSATADITLADVTAHGTPKLIAVVDTEGNTIDVNLLAANANN
jgi:prepilin-type N-terminal cleavage/methylation domain-containing protein